MTDALWQAYAIRYGWHHRVARENFLGGDPHDESPMPIDYYIWAVTSPQRTYVIDTGFDATAAARRGRTLTNSPAEGLAKIGIDAAAVENVIITHMHYDHCGNHAMFPRARYHLQDREMFFATGRHMCNAHMRIPFDEEDVHAMVSRVFANRVEFHDGDTELAPGLSLHYVGGHSMGLQMVRVRTRRGWVVLASDAAHYYANLDRGLAYPITYNVGEALQAYNRARALADSEGHIIPGHDPEVLRRYPAPSAGLEGWIARLD